MGQELLAQEHITLCNEDRLRVSAWHTPHIRKRYLLGEAGVEGEPRVLFKLCVEVLQGQEWPRPFGERAWLIVQFEVYIPSTNTYILSQLQSERK